MTPALTIYPIKSKKVITKTSAYTNSKLVSCQIGIQNPVGTQSDPFQQQSSVRLKYMVVQGEQPKRKLDTKGRNRSEKPTTSEGASFKIGDEQ